MHFNNHMSHHQIAEAIAVLAQRNHALSLDQYENIVESILKNPLLEAAVMLHPIAGLNDYLRYAEDYLAYDLDEIKKQRLTRIIERLDLNYYKKLRHHAFSCAQDPIVLEHNSLMALYTSLSNLLFSFSESHSFADQEIPIPYLLAQTNILITNDEYYKESLEMLILLEKQISNLKTTQPIEHHTACKLLIKALSKDQHPKMNMLVRVLADPGVLHRRLLDCYLEITPLKNLVGLSPYHHYHALALNMMKKEEINNLFYCYIHEILSEMIVIESPSRAVQVRLSQKKPELIESIQHISFIPKKLSMINAFLNILIDQNDWPAHFPRTEVTALRSKRPAPMASIKDWQAFCEKNASLYTDFLERYKKYTIQELERVSEYVSQPLLLAEPLMTSHAFSITICRQNLLMILGSRKEDTPYFRSLCAHIKIALTKKHQSCIRHINYILECLLEPLMTSFFDRYMREELPLYTIKCELGVQKAIIGRLGQIQHSLFLSCNTQHLFPFISISDENRAIVKNHLLNNILKSTTSHHHYHETFPIFYELLGCLHFHELSQEQKNNFLLFVSRYGYQKTHILEKTLIHGANPDCFDHENKTPLILLCERNAAAEAEILLSFSAKSINFLDHFRNTAAHYAAIHNHIECLQVLKRHGGYFCFFDIFGQHYSTLKIAANHLALDSLKELLFDLEYQVPMSDVTSVFFAAIADEKQFILLPTLLKYAFLWNLPSEYKNKALEVLIRFPVLLHEALQLLQSFSDLDYHYKNALMFSAIKEKNAELLSLLLAEGACVDAITLDQKTLLMHAVENLFVEGVSILLSYSCTLKITDPLERTAYKIAKSLPESDNKNAILRLIENHNIDQDIIEFFSPHMLFSSSTPLAKDSKSRISLEHLEAEKTVEIHSEAADIAWDTWDWHQTAQFRSIIQRSSLLFSSQHFPERIQTCSSIKERGKKNKRATKKKK